MLELLAFSVDDYKTTPPLASILFTFSAVFAILWIVELAARPVLGPVLARVLNLPLLTGQDARIKLGRCAMSSLAMAWYTYEGYFVLMGQGGWSTILSHGFEHFPEGTSKLDVHLDRMYFYSPAAQRLCLFHAAWEVKNLFDSIMHGDGAIFIGHHIFTFLVAVGCMSPIYHLYVCYYLGLSEISSVVLPFCALLDDTPLGIPALGELLPSVKLLFGGLFAMLFLVFRIVLWLLAAYIYSVDGFAVIGSGLCRSVPLLAAYLCFMLGFSLLQLFWLAELVMRVSAFLKGVPYTGMSAANIVKKET